MRSDDAGKLLLRIALAAVVLFHGVFKLRHGVAWIGEPLGSLGLPAWLAYGTYVAEVGAPILLLAGWQVPLAALAVACDMLMAIALVFRGQLTTVKDDGGGWAIELEVLILSMALALAFLGAGRYRIGGRGG
jgi:putative oxidoreductase